MCKRAEMLRKLARAMWRTFAKPVTFFDVCSPRNFVAIETRHRRRVVRPAGLEPAAPGLEGQWRVAERLFSQRVAAATHASYPRHFLLRGTGFCH